MRSNRQTAGFVLALFAVLALGVAAACSESRPPPQPASFDRPTDVDFVCINDGEVVRLDDCDGDNDENDDLDNDRDGVDEDSSELHAVVTQSARGEIAAVNLQTRRILDNRRDVPGYTFVPAGELPIAIVVPREHPQLTYVASYGSRDVYVLRTDTLVSLSNEDAFVQRVALSAESDAGTAGASPSDLLLTPDEGALLVTLPEAGQVLRLPIVRCEAGASDCVDGTIDEDGITAIALDEAVPPVPEPVLTEDRYALVCDFNRPPMPPMPAARPQPEPAAARPIAFALDRSCEGDACARVLVADEARPMLHVLDLAALQNGGDALREPIATGVPTRDVVVTPRVPVEIASDETTYYVYAIDATDGSVLALENDQVLAFNRDPRGRIDRLPIPGGGGRPAALAVSLEVFSPEYDERDPGKQIVRTNDSIVADEEECLDDVHVRRTPRRLRGVFLAAALADNSLRVFDVHDMELARPDADPEMTREGCEYCIDGVSGAQVVRHHPRLAVDLFADNEVDRDPLRPVVNSIAYIAEGVVYGVRNNGRTATPLAPALDCIACDPGLAQAFPDPEDQEFGTSSDDGGVANAAEGEGEGEGEEAEAFACPAEQSAVVCMPSDPWVGAAEGYQFVWEGILPSSNGGDGRFVTRQIRNGDELVDNPENQTGALEWLGGVAFCEAGVLGQVDVAAVRDDSQCDADVPPPSGDQLVITAKPRADSRIANEHKNKCAELRAALEDEDTKPVAFRILAAFTDRLAIEPKLIDRIGEIDSYEDVIDCYGDAPLTFDVRVGDSFRVFNARGGVPSRVVANLGNRCAVLPGSDPGLSGRAWRGCAYRDAALQIKLSSQLGANVSEPPSGLALQIAGSSSVPTLALDTRQIGLDVTATVPSRLRYSSASQQLYLVDTHRGGLIPITLDPFPTAPPYSFY